MSLALKFRKPALQNTYSEFTLYGWLFEEYTCNLNKKSLLISVIKNYFKGLGGYLEINF